MRLGELAGGCQRAGAGAGERLDDRQGRGQSGLFFRAELGQETDEPLGPHGPAAGQQRPALGGDVDLHDPPIPGVSGPFDQAGLPQAGDQLGHRRLRHPLRGREQGSLQGPDRSSVARVEAAVSDSPLGGLSERISPAARSSPAATSVASERSGDPAEISITNLYHIRMFLRSAGAQRSGARFIGSPAMNLYNAVLGEDARSIKLGSQQVDLPDTARTYVFPMSGR